MNETLKMLRKKHDYTQENLAAKIHVSRQTISNWETGKSTPDIQSVNLLSTIYGEEILDIFDISEKEEISEYHSEMNQHLTLFLLFVIVMSSFIPLAALVSLYIVMQYKEKLPKGLFKGAFYYLMILSLTNVTVIIGLLSYLIFSQ